VGIKRVGLILIAVIIGLGCCGVSYACWNNTWWSHTWWNHTAHADDCSVEFESAESNDPGYTIDPGYDKHVAKTTVKINNRRWYRCWGSDLQDKLIVTVCNAYPCYQPTVDYWVKVESQKYCAKLTRIKINGDVVAAGEEVPVYHGDLVVTVNPPQKIEPCDSASGNITIHVKQQAEQSHTYKFTVTMDYECITCIPCEKEYGGTPGYWQNWDQHYSQDEIDEWLNIIDDDSFWLVPDCANPSGTIDTDDLDAIRDNATEKGATSLDRFLCHYLATRLNVEAGRLDGNNTHDVTSIRGWYLVLSDPNPTLSEIIFAIEEKYDTSNRWLLNIMKNICDALNNLEI